MIMHCFVNNIPTCVEGPWPLAPVVHESSIAIRPRNAWLLLRDTVIIAIYGLYAPVNSLPPSSVLPLFFLHLLSVQL